jgi:hypothetical protein
MKVSLSPSENLLELYVSDPKAKIMKVQAE